MPDFPSAVPDIPDSAVTETLFTMHGGLGHVPATNRVLANLRALATKLGLNNGTGPPAANALLRRTATGESAWGKGIPADLTGAGAGDALKVLRTTDGTTVLLDKIQAGDHAAGSIAIPDLSPAALVAAVGDNPIINGDFSTWQRGTAFGAGQLYPGGYSVDRWSINNTVAGGAVQVNQLLAHAIGLPPSATVPYSNATFYLTCTTPKATMVAGDNLLFDYKMEGYLWQMLAQRQFTVSFWIRTSKVGTYGFAVLSTGAALSYVAPFVVNAANTWEYKTITVSASPATLPSGSWDYANGIGAFFRWTLAQYAGSATATTNQWISGNVSTTAAQCNWLDTSGAQFSVQQVRVTPGAYAAPFAPRPPALEALLCKRYFERLTHGVPSEMLWSGTANAANQAVFVVPYSEKRATPTIGTPTASAFAVGPYGATVTAISIDAIGPTTARLYATIGTSVLLSGGAAYLYSIAGAAPVEVAAEL